jgi:hypothetical protein
MQGLLHRFEQYEYGHRPLTEFDSIYVDRLDGVEIVWTDKDFAFTFMLKGQQFVALPRGVRGLRLLLLMLLPHECYEISS